MLPKAVLFDLGGTLLGERSFRIEAWGQKIVELAEFPETLDFAAIFGDGAAIYAEIRKRTLETAIEFPMNSLLRLFHERFGISLSIPGADVELEFWKTTTTMDPEAGVREVLEELASASVPLGIVSNSMFSGDVLSWELTRHGLDGYFQFVISSADYGFRKPHPLLFETAVAKIGRSPADVWFVGDSPDKDVAGAQQVGLRTAWYNTTGASSEIKPEAEFSRWSDFLGLVRD